MFGMRVMVPKKNCDVENCGKESKRTVSRERAGTAIQQAGLSLTLRDKKTKVHLCADHYRKIKKQLRKERKLERLRWEI